MKFYQNNAHFCLDHASIRDSLVLPVMKAFNIDKSFKATISLYNKEWMKYKDDVWNKKLKNYNTAKRKKAVCSCTNTHL